MRDNYDRFVRQVKKSGVVWGLRSEKGWAARPSREYDCNVYLFWSDEAGAQKHCINEWAAYKPAQIPLKEFMDFRLKNMHEAAEIVGVNLSVGLAVLEVEPILLNRDLIEYDQT